MNNYLKLRKKIEEIFKINNIINILYWDLSTNIPCLAINSRKKEIQTLKNLFHQSLTSINISNLIELADKEKAGLNNWQLANLREIKRRYALASCVDKKLQKEHDFNVIECEGAWNIAKETDDYDKVKPYLNKVIISTREITKAKEAYINKTKYEILVDSYDQARKLSTLKDLYSKIKTKLPNIISKILEKQKSETLIPISNCLDKKQQYILNRKIMELLGFNFKAGRLDQSSHSFCGGTPHDVRLMVKSGNNFLENILKVAHETGHGLYEQSLPNNYRNQPIGKASGMAIHESQSLIMEMQIARSKEFMILLSRILRDDFNLKGKEFQADNLHKHIIKIIPNMIRLESDELTYLLHIVMRCEIEEELIEGNLGLDDLPEIWNEKMQLYLGITPNSNKNGCLQDIHWFKGYFGYFPTYCIGAILASMLMNKIKQEDSLVFHNISHGNFSNINTWLNNNIRSFGSLKDVDTLIKESTGQELSVNNYFHYVEEKYLS